MKSEQVLFLQHKETLAGLAPVSQLAKSVKSHQPHWLAEQRARADCVEKQACQISQQAQKGSCTVLFQL